MALTIHPRKPDWLKIRLPGPEALRHQITVEKRVSEHDLHTVCVSAHCQNLVDCWGKGIATFMILGNRCTRNCGFCAVNHGDPLPLDSSEPLRVAQTIHSLGLRYVVLTSVDRDDLPDGGSAFWRAVVEKVREVNPKTLVEVLIPDFAGQVDSLVDILKANPVVVAHNLETVQRLTPLVRDPRFGYRQSLEVLHNLKKFHPQSITKSGLMLGHGETPAEVREAIADLRSVGVDILTLSQYLQPTRAHLPVVEFPTPSFFQELAGYARDIGFVAVVAGPLVRSSYRAREVFERIVRSRRGEKLEEFHG